MLNEKKNIDKIWEKYNDYKNGKSKNVKFLNSNIIGTNRLLYFKELSLCIVTLMCMFLVAGGAYAGVKSVINPKIDNQSQIDLNFFENYKDFIYVKNERIYYKKIETYEEYMKYKNNNNNFIDIEPNEFDECFLLCFLGNYSDRVGLYVKNLEVTDTSINVDISRYPEEDTNFVFIKMKKENNRDTVNVKFIPTDIPNLPNYALLNELPENYSKEQAIHDNCVVIDNSSTESNFIFGKDMLLNFIDKTEKNINDSIRIVDYFYSETPDKLDFNIIDIEYKNEKYIVGIRQIRNNELTTFSPNFEYVTEDEYKKALEYIYFESYGFEKMEYPTRYWYYLKQKDCENIFFSFDLYK